MTNHIRFLCACLIAASIVLLLPGVGTAETEQPIRVLFIGNSYTSANDLPAMLATLSRAAERPLLHDRVTKGGFTLQRHLDGGAAAAKIRASDWDYVVLQEQSQLPVVDPAAMHASARQWHAVMDATGAETVFFLTWARQHRPAMQDGLNRAYLEIARQLDATVAPVGIAWAAALKADPELKLHKPDKSHPTRTGTYLAACVFYAVIHQQNPVGLPGACAGLADPQARRLQQVAWQVVQQQQHAAPPAASR